VVGWIYGWMWGRWLVFGWMYGWVSDSGWSLRGGMIRYVGRWVVVARMYGCVGRWVAVGWMYGWMCR